MPKTKKEKTKLVSDFLKALSECQKDLEVWGFIDEFVCYYPMKRLPIVKEIFLVRKGKNMTDWVDKDYLSPNEKIIKKKKVLSLYRAAGE
jgi:hypothetical protein